MVMTRRNQYVFSHPYLACIGNSAILVDGEEFFEGLQSGYNNFLSVHQGKIVSEQDIYTACMSIVDVTHSATCQAGIIAGWMAAMFEPLNGASTYKLFEIKPDTADETFHQDHQQLKI